MFNTYWRQKAEQLESVIDLHKVHSEEKIKLIRESYELRLQNAANAAKAELILDHAGLVAELRTDIGTLEGKLEAYKGTEGSIRRECDGKIESLVKTHGVAVIGLNQTIADLKREIEVAKHVINLDKETAEVRNGSLQEIIKANKESNQQTQKLVVDLVEQLKSASTGEVTINNEN